MDRKPNVLFFCADEMRADHMGCMGNSVVQTPNLDRLASEGTLFRRAYCNNPICMPARATMFTGLLPRDHGVRINGQNLNSDLPVLPSILKEAGYRTHSAGKMHLTAWVPKDDPPEPERYPESMDHWNQGRMKDFPVPYYGFDRVDFVGGHTSFIYGEYMQWLKDQGGDAAQLSMGHALEAPSGAQKTYKMSLPEELHYNRFISDRVIETIEASKESDQPFFAWCSYPDPHVPVAPPAPYCHMYNPDDIPLPPSREGEIEDLPPVYRDVFSGEVQANGTDNTGVTDAHRREILAGTYGMVTHLDAEVGRVLDALEKSGQRENTIIVFTSDHGDMMGDHGLLWKGFYTFQGCIQIPLIMSVPDGISGQVLDSLICQIDYLPTLLALVEIAPSGADWRETETPFQRGSVARLFDLPGVSQADVLRCQDASAPRQAVVIENDDPSTGLQPRAIVTDRYRMTVYPGQPGWGELFDLEQDPDELVNAWALPEYQDVKVGLMARLLDQYARETPWHPIPPWNS